MSLTATDCTRPAESPLAIFTQSKGETMNRRHGPETVLPVAFNAIDQRYPVT